MIVAIYMLGFVISMIHLAGVHKRDEEPKVPGAIYILVASVWFVFYPALGFLMIRERFSKSAP